MPMSLFPDPSDRFVICTSTTRPTAPFEGQQIYETDSDNVYWYNGTAWIQRYIICLSTTRPGSAGGNTAGYPTPFAGLQIFETDTSRVAVYDGSAWQSVTFKHTAAKAWKNTASQSFSVGSTTQITFDAEDWDYGNNFASNVYTAPETGIYHIDAMVNANSPAATERFLMIATVAGGEVARDDFTPGAATSFVLKISTDLAVTAGQAIDIQAQQVAGTARAIQGAHRTFLDVRRVC